MPDDKSSPLRANAMGAQVCRVQRPAIQGASRLLNDIGALSDRVRQWANLQSILEQPERN